MNKSKLLIFIPAVVGLLFVATPEVAEAQYYGYRRARPARPHRRARRPPRNQARSRSWYKHRFHGYVGANVMGLVVMDQKLDTIGTLGHGGGIGVFGGVRMGRYVSLEGNWTFTVHDEYWDNVVEADSKQIQTITGDLKIHIPTWSRFEPYFQVGGGYGFFGVVGWNDRYNRVGPDRGYIYTSGPTFTAGAGADAWLGRHITIGGRVLYRGMYFTKPRWEVCNEKVGCIEPTDNFINGLGIEANVAFHF